jgi:hypothetical protein
MKKLIILQLFLLGGITASQGQILKKLGNAAKMPPKKPLSAKQKKKQRRR